MLSDTRVMQIGSGTSPLTLAMLKTLGSQLAAGAPAAASPAVPDLGSASPSRNEPAGPPEPGRITPRGTFVDLKA